MNVLFVATYPDLSGATISFIELVEQIYKRGNIGVFIVVTKKGFLTDRLDDLGINYQVIQYLDRTVSTVIKFRHLVKYIIYPGVNGIANYRIKKFIKQNHISAIYYNAITVDAGFLAAKELNLKIIWHIREYLEDGLNRKLMFGERSMNRLKAADKIIAVSEGIKNEYEMRLGVNNIITVYDGISIDKLSNNNFKKINNDVIKFVIVGRISSEKNQLETIQVINHLYKTGYNNIHLNLVGPLENKEYVAKIKDYINIHKLTNRVTLCGPIYDQNKIWKFGDVTIIPSKKESYGRTAIESIAHGKFIIGADTGGIGELIRYTGVGLTYKSGNWSDLENKMKNFMDNYDKYMCSFFKVQTKIIKKFDVEQSTKKIENIIRF